MRVNEDIKNNKRDITLNARTVNCIVQRMERVDPHELIWQIAELRREDVDLARPIAESVIDYIGSVQELADYIQLVLRSRCGKEESC